MRTISEKTQIIKDLTVKLNENPNFYLTDIGSLNASNTSLLRGNAFKMNIELMVVKNTLLKKALESSNLENVSGLFNVLKGETSIMFCETANVPAKMIKEFTAKQKLKNPSIKGAYIENEVYVGENLVDVLSTIKSKSELLGEVIGLLQSPPKTVLSALLSGGHTISGIVKTLSEKE